MALISRGFTGRRRTPEELAGWIPPGQQARTREGRPSRGALSRCGYVS
ncbi:MAG TPA: hypothetical protein VK304_01990 [Thermoleophilaceae bacterium]|nr:hypothetical protein [Thermoleophilaceae bacterium]